MHIPKSLHLFHGDDGRKSLLSGLDHGKGRRPKRNSSPSTHDESETDDVLLPMSGCYRHCGPTNQKTTPSPEIKPVLQLVQRNGETVVVRNEEDLHGLAHMRKGIKAIHLAAMAHKLRHTGKHLSRVSKFAHIMEDNNTDAVPTKYNDDDDAVEGEASPKMSSNESSPHPLNHHSMEGFNKSLTGLLALAADTVGEYQQPALDTYEEFAEDEPSCVSGLA